MGLGGGKHFIFMSWRQLGEKLSMLFSLSPSPLNVAYMCIDCEAGSERGSLHLEFRHSHGTHSSGVGNEGKDVLIFPTPTPQTKLGDGERLPKILLLSSVVAEGVKYDCPRTTCGSPPPCTFHTPAATRQWYILSVLADCGKELVDLLAG